VRVFIFIAGLLLVLGTLLDAFETILLPRRINHRFRYSRLYYRTGWRLWRWVAAAWPPGRARESTLGMFGPLSLLGLFFSWVVSLVFGFAMMQWSVRGIQWINLPAATQMTRFTSYLYYSGTTIFTLGLGDVIPMSRFSRMLTIAESGVGLGFLAIIISYLPVLYQAFSKRELSISLLDARAGSPPSCGELLLRLARDGRADSDDDLLREWEQWCAELLESHVSFPVLAYYRSQHANQSWLAALATMLDSCALLLTVAPARNNYRAQVTFGAARHAAVDIALIFLIRPQQDHQPRLSPEALATLLGRLSHHGRQTDAAAEVQERFSALRAMYEPFLEAMATHFMLTLPPMVATDTVIDNWQRSAWMPRTPGIGSLPIAKPDGDHFD